MSKKQIIFGIALVILLSGLAFYAMNEKEKGSTLNINDTAFSIQDTASIDKIFIASKFGWKSLLEKNNNGEWILNDKYRVNKMQLNILLKTLYWQRIKRPVHKGERESVIKSIATKGSKVEIYQSGELSKTFYVGGDAKDSKGTYFIMEGSENPFVLYMPNHTGFLSPRYVVKEENYRHTQIFGSNLKTFEEIKVSYPLNPSMGFIIKNEDGNAGLVGIEDYDQVALNNYVSSYNRIHITRYVEDDESIAIIDSLKAYPAHVEISVKDKKSSLSNSVKLYLREEDPDGMVGVANMEGDLRYVVVQKYIFNKLIVPVSSFRQVSEISSS